jgi:restriction system protein
VPVPTFDQFIEPLLRYLAAHPQGATASAAQEAAAHQLKLTVADRGEVLPSGMQAVYKNRIGWAHDRLKRAGFSGSPKRGLWKLTDAGVGYAAKYKLLPRSEVERLANANRESRAKPAVTTCSTTSFDDVSTMPSDKASPEERIEAALAELRESVASDLLESIGRSPPEFFEQLVLDLLHAMGYGTSRSDLQRVGGARDGGIDGSISLDRLGLEKVYVQAKRWKNNVGSPEIQGFMGALQLQSASKGVFITTSGFTRDARDAAAKARGSIVLIDGSSLSSLMIDHGVAVSHKTLRLPKVDNDYFEDA